MTRAFIGVGSNIHPEENVLRALRLLAGQERLTGISTFFRTPPEGNVDQPPFLNGVVSVETNLTPEDLKHQVLHAIEVTLGRTRGLDPNAPRTIDLDLLLYDDRVVRSPELELPDPLITRRAYLALPLQELAPDLVLPGTGIRISEVAERLSGQMMEPLVEYTSRLRRELLGSV